MSSLQALFSGAGDGRGAAAIRRIPYRQHMVYVAMGVLVVVFSQLSPYFLTRQNFGVIILETSATAIVACAATYVLIAGDIDFSVGAMYAFGGTFAAYAMQHYTWGWGLAAVAALGIGVALGLLNGLLAVKVGIPSFLVTLGTMGIVRGIDLTLTYTSPVPIYNSAFNSFFGGHLLGIRVPIVWAVCIAVVMAVVLARTVTGRHLYAVGGNREVARLAGIRVDRIRVGNFVLSGFLASLTGLIVAGRIGTGMPTGGTGMELDVITAAVLGGTNLFGGRGTIVGTIMGALLITVIGNGLVLTGVNPNTQQSIKGAILIVSVAFRIVK